MSPDAADLLGSLLHRDAVRRIKFATNLDLSPAKELFESHNKCSSSEVKNKKAKKFNPVIEMTPEWIGIISYDCIRNHSFFDGLREDLHAECNDELWQKNIHERDAVTVPLLSEICIRAVAKAVVQVATLTSDNAGIKPDIPWVKVYLNVYRMLSHEMCYFRNLTC